MMVRRLTKTAMNMMTMTTMTTTGKTMTIMKTAMMVTKTGMTAMAIRQEILRRRIYSALRVSKKVR
jgi:hypothetical protein